MVNTKTYQVVIIGHNNVGKSSLVVQFMQNYYIDEYNPTLEDVYRKQCIVDDQVCIIEVLDTSGNDMCHTLTDQYMRYGEGFICVFSLVHQQSLVPLHNFITRLSYIRGSTCKTPILIVGNKNDLTNDCDIMRQEGIMMAKQYNGTYMETSAKTRQGVDEIFYEIIRIIRKMNMSLSISKKNKICKCNIL